MTHVHMPNTNDAIPVGLPKDLDGTPLASMSSADVDLMTLYLRKARDRAEKIRENAAHGSYMDRVLERTIEGINQELSNLKYLLADKDLPTASPRRMRPAI